VVKMRPSRTPEELLAIYEESNDEEVFDSSINGIGDISALKMLDQLGVRYRFLNARFTGALPGPHEIGLRSATTILGEFQDVVAEIGAVIRDDVPQRGSLSREIIRETELRFSPVVAAGSVIFTLNPAEVNDGLWMNEQSDLLDQSLQRLFEVFDKIERPGTTKSNPGKVSEVLLELGPRTARHLFHFAQALDNEGLALDFGWTQSGAPLRKSSLSRAGAAHLGSLAKDATTRTREVALRGELKTLGRDNRHRLVDDLLGTITVTSSDALTDELHPAFKRGRIELVAVETETVNAATGASSRTYEATSVTLLGE
jgi:hypothetical protein